MEIVDIMRMAERILVVAGGILCIFLGYRLFSIARLQQSGSGKFKTQVFEFTATKVGPGVFFALFGAYVLFTSLTTLVRTEVSIESETAARDIARLATLSSNLPQKEDRDAANAAADRLRKLFVGTRTYAPGETPVTQ
jgi:hypothetical protein